MTTPRAYYRSKLSWRHYSRLIFSRAFIFGAAILVQLLLLNTFRMRLIEYSVGFYFLSLLLSLVIVLMIVSSKTNPAYKLIWTILIFALPPIGALLYLLAGQQLTKVRNSSQAQLAKKLQRDFLSQPPGVLTSLKNNHRVDFRPFNYLLTYGKWPVYDQTQTKYLPLGQDFFNSLLADLKKAQHFIFLEFFIIEEKSYMWQEILKILRAKAAAGVEVRLIYDDYGSIVGLPTSYPQKLASWGIKALAFNRFRPFLALNMNYRDHRKIVVIDSRLGYVGGINIADRYINQEHQYRFWKDTALRIDGRATESLAAAFLNFWNTNKPTDHDLSAYHYLDNQVTKITAGLVQPFVDSPLDKKLLGKHTYLNLINRARATIKIITPYLVLDNETITALILAAQTGVVVEIIVPSVADKWYSYYLSCTFYQRLLENGVKIYEYQPGFIHAKQILVDDEIGLVGSINCDYRSFYLNFESAVLMYQTPALQEIKHEWSTLLHQSHLVTIAQTGHYSFPRRIANTILQLLAPLM